MNCDLLSNWIYIYIYDKPDFLYNAMERLLLLKKQIMNYTKNVFIYIYDENLHSMRITFQTYFAK